MIDQIEESFFLNFDNSSGADRLVTIDRLTIQYAHKIRQLIDKVNELEERINKLEVKRI